MKNILKHITLVAVIAVTTTSAQASIQSWLKETAVSTLNIIKKHPAILSGIGFATAAACWYKGSEYQEKSNDYAAAFITHLDEQDKRLINESIATSLKKSEAINVSLGFYDRIADNHMSKIGKASLALLVEKYNKELKEQQRINEQEPGYEHTHFKRAKQELCLCVNILNNNKQARNYANKLEQYGDRYYVLAALTGIASLIPLAISYYRS